MTSVINFVSTTKIVTCIETHVKEDIMNIGLVKENLWRESRVALTPTGVAMLINNGHTVYVEQGAGELCGFLSDEYISAGARIAFSTEEVYGRADLLLRMSPVCMTHLEYLREGQMIASTMHLAVAPPEVHQALLEKRITTIGFELIQNKRGNYPLLVTMSEIAGRMCIQIAAQYLQSNRGGRGILLSGVPGVPPAVIVILGAGVVGRNAAMTALGVGAQIIILDDNVMKLRKIETLSGAHLTTSYSNAIAIEKSIRFADVVIGAVLRPGGQRTPGLVTEKMIETMKPKSLLIDVSIDQGGCFETSRPTNLVDPVYEEHGVIHYCVPNIPATVARTATHSINNALLPFVIDIANNGLAKVVDQNPPLGRSIFTHNGYCTNEHTSRIFDVPHTSIYKAL